MGIPGVWTQLMHKNHILRENRRRRQFYFSTAAHAIYLLRHFGVLAPTLAVCKSGMIHLNTKAAFKSDLGIEEFVSLIFIKENITVRTSTHSTRWGWMQPAGTPFCPWPGWCELGKPSALACSCARCRSPPSSTRCPNCAASRSRRSQSCIRAEGKCWRSPQGKSLMLSRGIRLWFIHAALQPNLNWFSPWAPSTQPWRRLQSWQQPKRSFYTSMHTHTHAHTNDW